MSSVVASFNALPREEKTPSGTVPSHWYFAIRHVPLKPPGDLVHIVQPDSEYVVTAGPGQINSLPTLAAKAKVIVPLLLDTFVKGVTRDPHGNVTPGTRPFAPWTWSCNDQELSKALETHMKELGVRAELCTIGTGTAREEQVGKKTWSRLLKSLQSMLGPTTQQDTFEPGPSSGKQCAVCGSTSKLQHCARCTDVHYCSKDCQKSHWKIHKAICGKRDQLDAHTYYNKATYLNNDAKALAKSLGLQLTENGRDGLMKTVRRLIFAGKDDDKNFQLLFGRNCAKDIGQMHREARIEILLDPPRGSPSYAVNSSSDATYLGPRSTRPASESEQEAIREVRSYQAMIAEEYAPGTEIPPNSIGQFISRLGADWAEKMPMLQLAQNTTDQGVHV